MVWFFVCVASIAFMGASNVAIFCFICIFLFSSFLLISKFGIRSILYLFLVILPTQQFFTMPISRVLTNFDIKIFVSLKEIVLLLMAIAIIKKATKIKFFFVDYAALCYLAVYFYGLAISGIGFSQIVSFREGAILVILYFTGRILYFYEIRVIEIVTIMFYISVPLVIFGFIERFIIGTWFWDYWGALNYLRTKFSTGLITISSINNIPANWFTLIGGEWYRRIVSTVGDAPSFSRYLSFSVVAFLYFKTLKKNLWSYFFFIISLICLSLTFGRGGILIAIGGFVCIILHSNIKYKYISIIPLLLVFILIVSNISLFNLNSAVALRHKKGFFEGTKTLIKSPAGHGLGTSGQLSMLYSQDIEENIQESYIGGLSYQLGIPGVASYSLWIFAITIYLFKKYLIFKKIDRDKAKEILFSISLLLGIYVTSYLSNSAISPISAGVLFIVVGVNISAVLFETELKNVVV